MEGALPDTTPVLGVWSQNVLWLGTGNCKGPQQEREGSKGQTKGKDVWNFGVGAVDICNVFVAGGVGGRGSETPGESFSCRPYRLYQICLN